MTKRTLPATTRRKVILYGLIGAVVLCFGIWGTSTLRQYRLQQLCDQYNQWIDDNTLGQYLKSDNGQHQRYSLDYARIENGYVVVGIYPRVRPQVIDVLRGNLYSGTLVRYTSTTPASYLER